MHDPTYTHDHDHDHGHHPDHGDRAFRVGIGGPVGTGKTALVAALCALLSDELRIGVVTNDIYTTEDADTLKRRGVLDAGRIVAVETGCCPHTAIREDITANLDAIADLEEREGPLDLVLVESGGDNLTLTFSKGLADVQLFVLDVAGGDKVPRKGGPGVTRSDLLVINKIDLAHLVNADLGVMERDAAAQRGDLPTVFVSLTSPEGAAPIAEWIRAPDAGDGDGRWLTRPPSAPAAGPTPRCRSGSDAARAGRCASRACCAAPPCGSAGTAPRCGWWVPGPRRWARTTSGCGWTSGPASPSRCARWRRRSSTRPAAPAHAGTPRSTSPTGRPSTGGRSR